MITHRKELLSQARGFAIVLTLVLLSLLVVIALAISSVSRINSNFSVAKTYQVQARQNALLGLRVALANLQRLAGPDQRTTATGNIRRNSDSPLQDPLVDTDARKYWTGVWDQNGNKLAWLVSGQQNDETAAITADFPDHPVIRLVGPGSLGTGTTMVGSYVYVQADPIKTETGPSNIELRGHYGYWVGDEGVKASSAVLDTIDQIDYPNGVNLWSTHHEQLRQMVLARPYMETIFSALQSNEYDEAIQGGLQRLISPEQLALIKTKSDGKTPFSSQWGRNFFNATLLASNVLADPVRGGLKQDLSSSAVSATLLTPLQKGWLDTRPTGLPDHGLADYAITSDTVGVHIAPVLSEFQIKIGFKRDMGSGYLNIKTQVQAELWNPYNANLLMTGGGKLEIRVKGLPTKVALDFKSGQPSVTGINLQRYIDTQHFSLSSVSPLDKFTPGQITTISGGTVLNPGNSNVGVLTEYLDDTGNPVAIANSSPKEMTVRDDDPADANIAIQVELLVGGVSVATYSPVMTFIKPLSVVQSSFNTLASATYTYGWGFALRDDITEWSDGSLSGASDPRVYNLNGAPGVLYDHFDTVDGFSSQAVDNASRKISTAKSSGVFSEGSSGDYVFFELPQQVTLSIGNLQHAIPSSVGPPNALGNPWGGDANALFDRAYFSGLPQDDQSWDGQTLSQFKSVPTNAPIVSVPSVPVPIAIPNSFLSLPIKHSQTSRNTLLDGTQNAQYFMQAGGFNVNSTSPDAWLAMLNGNEITDWQYRGLTKVKTRTLDHAYFHFSQSGSYSNYFDAGFSTSTSGSTSSRYTQGVRDIPESRMKDFAQAVVKEIRAHGRPYPSIQAFLNAGVIDRAIADAELNGTTGVRGSPYFLSQADVVSLLGPALASRSDTFRIRAYGDAVNLADAGNANAPPESVAYCEVLVQRIPESDAGGNGRKFVITYFRWLGPDDI